ncbi:hypothetical protein ACLB2K_011404 [Fragaria x ananassa]
MVAMFATVASAVMLMADFAKFLEVFNDLCRGNQELERYLHEIGLALRFDRSFQTRPRPRYHTVVGACTIKSDTLRIMAVSGEIKTDTSEIKAFSREIKADTKELKANIGELKVVTGDIKAEMTELKAFNGLVLLRLEELSHDMKELSKIPQYVPVAIEESSKILPQHLPSTIEELLETVPAAMEDALEDAQKYEDATAVVFENDDEDGEAEALIP